MIGDKLDIRPQYYVPAEAIMKELDLNYSPFKLVISICGESGSGKSILAIALQNLLAASGKISCVLHMDDYFFLPPQATHLNRVKDLAVVGQGEVNLPLLQQHIRQFKQGVDQIEKPLIHFRKNSIASEVIYLRDLQIVIVEGTYTGFLEDVDLKIFLERTYHETREDRQLRNRDQKDPIIEDVLAIEHAIIKNQKPEAHFCIDKNYRVSKTNMKSQYIKK
jgi:uridine kinase